MTSNIPHRATGHIQTVAFTNTLIDAGIGSRDTLLRNFYTCKIRTLKPKTFYKQVITYAIVAFESFKTANIFQKGLNGQKPPYHFLAFLNPNMLLHKDATTGGS